MRHILLALIFVFAAFPLPAEAQSPPIDWEIGWETETDPEIMELNGKDNRLNSQNHEPASGDMTFSLTIEFWINNPRPFPVEIEFQIGFDSEWDFSGTANHPGEATINALSNESFSLELWGDGFIQLMGQAEKSSTLASGDNIYEFSLTATEVIAGQSTPTEEKEIEKSLQFSKYNAYILRTSSNHDTNPTIITSQSVYAGSDESIRVLTGNAGNVVDTIIDAEVEIKSCPQLVIEGLEGVVGESPSRVMYTSSTLTITAPQSHPEKECEVVFKVRSEGSGLWYSNNQKFTVYVVGEQPGEETSDGTSSSDQESMSNDIEVSDSGILPSLTILSTLSMVGFAAILGREKR